MNKIKNKIWYIMHIIYYGNNWSLSCAFTFYSPKICKNLTEYYTLIHTIGFSNFLKIFQDE